MAEHFRMMIVSGGGAEIPCMPFDVDEIGLNGAGVCDMGQAALRVSYVENSLKVNATGQGDVSLERGGRTHLLGKRPIVLLPGDVLVVDGHCIEIVKIWQYAKPQSEPKRRGVSSLKKVFGAVASFVMAVIPACHPRVTGDAPDPNYNPDDDAKVPSVDVQEMGEPEDPNYENYEWVKAQRSEEAREAVKSEDQPEPEVVPKLVEQKRPKVERRLAGKPAAGPRRNDRK